MLCPNCGKELRNDSKFCTKCGASLDSSYSVDEKGQASGETNVNHSYFVWKDKYTYIAIVGMILLAAIIGMVFKFHNSSVSGDETTKTANNNDDVYPDSDSDNSELEKYFESSEDLQEIDTTDEDSDDSKLNEPNISYPKVSANHITGIYASSELEEEQYNAIHYATNIFDGDTFTAWSEGVDGPGIGEKLVISFDEECEISGISILNGYQKSENLYYKNARPSDMEIIFSDGNKENIHIHDEMGWETIQFSETYVSSSMTIVITDVYDGSKYEDTLITELELF